MTTFHPTGAALLDAVVRVTGLTTGGVLENAVSMGLVEVDEVPSVDAARELSMASSTGLST